MNINDVNNEAFKKIQNAAMSAASSAIQSLLNSATSISVQDIEVCKAAELDYDLFKPAMLIRSSFTEGFTGNVLLIFNQSDLELMLTQLMGLTPEVTEDFKFDELNISAVSEIVNQMMDAGASVLSEIKGFPVKLSTSEVFADEALQSVPGLVDILEDDDICAVTHSVSIENVTNGRFIMVFPESITSVMTDGNLNFLSAENDKDKHTVEDFSLPDISISYNPDSVQDNSFKSPAGSTPAAVSQVPAMHQDHSEYSSFQNTLSQEELNNLQLLMNIPLELSIEIGSTQKKVDEILSFTHGTVVELDNPADAPVNVTVNGHLIAKGDVVVVDDHFAVRVTEVLKSELINTLRDRDK